MALPNDVTTATLTFGPYGDAEGLAALVASGGKLFPVDPLTDKPINVIHVASGMVIVPTPVAVTIGSDGTGSVGPLPHTDNPGLSPVGFAYRVEWNIASKRPSPGNKTFAVPTAAGAVVDFDLLDVAEAVPGVLVPIGEGPQGDPGLTAYEVAVAEGFVGTEAAWLASLKGEQGDAGVADDASVAALVPGPGATATALRVAFVARSPVSALSSTSEDPRITWLSRFPPAHGWTVTPAGTATADANNTERPGLSTQAVKANTAGGNVTVQLTGQTWDLTGRSIVLALQTKTPDLDGGLQVTIGDATLASNYTLAVTTKSGMQYRSGRYTFIEIPIESMTATGTPNRAAIARVQIIFLGALPNTYYLAGVGSRTVHPKWPNGALTLGFDDGYLDHFTIAGPKLAERGWPGVAHLIVDRLGTPNFMALDQVRQLQNLNGWMVAPHSYTGAAHDNRWTSLTASQLETEARNLHDWMRENGFAGWRHFAAPGGVFNTATQDVAARYFSTQRQAGTVQPAAMLQGRPLPLTPQWMPSGVVDTTNLAAVLGLVQKAKDGGLWTQLVFHRFGVGAEISQAQFNQLMDDIAAIGIPVVTPMQVMGF